MIPSWQEFLQALEVRFAPFDYEDPHGSLFKLTQRVPYKIISMSLNGLLTALLVSLQLSC